jgi:hypothetical protein
MDMRMDPIAMRAKMPFDEEHAMMFLADGNAGALEHGCF